MQDHFLRNIEIIDYKCFKNFNVKNFNRLNLISGKNNIGKTAFMESLYINLYSITPVNMAFAMGTTGLTRDQLEFINEIKLKNLLDEYKLKIVNAQYNAKSNISNSKFGILNSNAKKEFSFDINNNKTIVNINDFSYEPKQIDNIKMLDKFGTSNNDLKSLYDNILKKDKEEFLNNTINKFDSNLEKFKIIEDKPKCKIIDTEIFRDINEFGDGLKHYISIVCALYASENGQLFIDEIDNGIHYTQLKRLWEIIFTISKKLNCQVFATTHSKEMINAFAKISKEQEDEDISFIELGENKDNEIKSITMNYERLQREINSGNEIRGW